MRIIGRCVLFLTMSFLFTVLVGTLPVRSAALTQITGSVLDEQRHPIAGAQVHLTGPITEATSTTADGLFSFNNLPAGSYRLDISKGGFNTSTQEDLVTTAGATTNVVFALQAASLTS